MLVVSTRPLEWKLCFGVEDEVGLFIRRQAISGVSCG